MIQFHKSTSAWLYAAGLLLFFGSAGFFATLTGGILLSLSLILIFQDPLLYYSGRFRSEGHSSALILTWILSAAAAVIWFTRESILIPADNPSQLLVRVRLVLLILFLISAAVAVLNRIFAGISEHTISPPSGVSELRMKTLLSVTLATVLFALISYSVYIKNPVLDLTFRNYSVSETARSLLKSVNKKTVIYAFIPVQQAVLSREKGYTPPELYRISEDIRVYLEQIPLINPLIKLEFRNSETETEGEFRGTANGTVVVRSFSEDVTFDGKNFSERRIFIQSERDLDQMERDLIRAVVQSASERRTAYFPSLNDERFFINDNTLRSEGMEILKEALRFHNFEVKSLGISEGWPSSVPEDADLLVLAGPRIPYSEDSKKAVLDYIARGGRVFASADPDGKESLDWLLAAYTDRFTFRKGNLTNVKNYTGLTVTTDTASHRITENLSLTGASSVPVVFPSAAWFDQVTPASDSPEKQKPLKTSFETFPLLYSSNGSYADLNKNKQKDAGETNLRAPLILTVSSVNDSDKKEKTPAAVLSSDTGWLTDSVQKFPLEKKNLHLAVESVLWLTENPLTAGLTSEPRESRRVQVSEELKLKNILIGIIIFPAGTVLLLSLGTWFYRKKRIWRESED